MRTFIFLSAQERGSGNHIQRPVPDKPPSRRRIPNVIRRPHPGFPHGRHRQRKAMCRYSGNHAPAQGRRSRSGFQRCSSITCGQFPASAYRPEACHGPAERAARIKRLKPCADLTETGNGSATEYCTGTAFNSQCAYGILSPGHSQAQDPDTLYSSGRYSHAPSVRVQII